MLPCNYEEDKNKVPMNKPCNIQNTNICNGIFHISFVKGLLINEGETTWGERESCRTGIGRSEATRRVNGIRSETTRYHNTRKWGITSKMVLGPPRKLSVVVSRNRRTMEWRKTLWLACKVQSEHISCLLPSMQLWLQSGTRCQAERRYQTFCHWKHRTQPRLPATFFVQQDVFSSKDITSKKFATKKAVKSPKITLIGSTKTKEEVKMSSFIYQKTALLRATKFSQKES